MNTLLAKTLALGALAFTAAASQAAVLTYGTFTGTTPDTTQNVDTIGSLGGFMVGITATHSTTYTLTGASFSISADGTRTARLRVYTEAGLGGAALATISGVTPAGTGSVTTFSGLNIAMTSGTTYWLVVDAGAGTGSLFAHSAAGADTASGATALSFAGARTTDASDTLTLANTTAFGGSDIPNFSVTVPEPHEYAMVAGLGLCAFAAYRRRNARVTA